MAAESSLHETHLDTLLSAVIASFGYWLLHSYARVLGRRLIDGTPLRPALLGQALRRERLLLAGAAVPICTLLVAWAAGASRGTAIDDAVWSAVIGIVAFEVFAGVRSQSSAAELAFEVGVGIVLGLAILALRVVLH